MMMNISSISLGYTVVEGVRLTSDVDLLYGDLITVNESGVFATTPIKGKKISDCLARNISHLLKVENPVVDESPDWIDNLVQEAIERSPRYRVPRNSKRRGKYLIDNIAFVVEADEKTGNTECRLLAERHYGIISRGIAHLHPEDEYSYNTGAKISIQRCIRFFPKEVRRVIWGLLLSKYPSLRGMSL